MPALLPWPRCVARGRGRLACRAEPPRARFTGRTTDRLERAVARFIASAGNAGFELVVDCRGCSPRYPALGDDESYCLEVSRTEVRLEASQEWGVLRGLATLAQLIEKRGGGISLARCRIDDAPRFPWRGLMLDPARHFMPLELLVRTIDAMALAKLNVLHLHLSDDQGFRFWSRHFPALAERGGGGDYYDPGSLEQLVEAAADRGIRVVPEIDVPGHCTSWLTAHPEWGTNPGGFLPSKRFGVHKACLDPTRDDVYSALQTLFGDLADTFPDRCIHIGGDEVNPDWWNGSPAVMEFMTRRAIPDARALQSHFNARLGAIIERLGRTLVGWDEIVHETLPRQSIVQCWRGAASRDRALAAGLDCVFSAGYYLDLFYPADIHYGFDPEGPTAELAAAEAAMRADPRLAHVSGGLGWATAFNAAATVDADTVPERPTRRGRVLGGEACLWSELVDGHVLNLRLWDRLPAVAERLWSDREVRDVDSLYRRTERFLGALASYGGIDVESERRRALESIGLSASDGRALSALFEVIEPVKWYARLLGETALRARVEGREAPATRPYGVDTRLDRVVDLIPAECPIARSVAKRVDAVLERQDAASRRWLLRLSRRWRSQRRACVRVGARVPQVFELDAVSALLADLADVVDAVLAGRAGGAERAVARSALEPCGELLIGVAPAIVRLVDGS